MAGYRTRQDSVGVPGAQHLLIRSLLDLQQYADPHEEAEAAGLSAATWPLFGVLWPSGRQLAAHMAARPLVPHERMLEVGCGLALASLVCHRRGIDVTASDCHPLASRFLLDNLRLNGLPSLAYRHGAWSPDGAPQAPGRPQAVHGRFDLIMGSDVLYERDDDGLLAGFIDRHAMPDAEVLIVDPDRGNRPAFNRRMADQGFVRCETRLRHVDAEGMAYKGRLLQYLRSTLR